MEYHQFFYDSLTIILQAFEDYLPKDYMNNLRTKYGHVINPSKSIYVEIFAFSNNTRTKIEQWKFKPKSETTQTQLARSYSQQNSNDDSELSFSQLNQPTFFKTLENIRKSIQPKLLLKKIDRPKVTCEIKDNEQQLIAFSSGNTFYFEVAEYENQLFQVKLSFKYNYEDEVVALEMNEIKALKESDSDEFQLLVDESYEDRLRQESEDNIKLIQQSNKENTLKNLLPFQLGKEHQHGKEHERKLSEKITSNKAISLGKKQPTESQKLIRQKREQQLQEIEKLFKNIDFSTVQSTKLKTFLEYLL